MLRGPYRVISETIVADERAPSPSRGRRGQSVRPEHEQRLLRQAAPSSTLSAFRLWSEEALRDIYRLQTLPALGHLVGCLLALFEGLKSAACYPRVVHEHVFATILWSDEAKALLIGKPLDRSLGHVPKTLPFFSYSIFRCG